MGMGYSARCKCGYMADFAVGGGMEDFETSAPFPNYCASCGLVEVNLASPTAQQRCPSCQSAAVMPYGKPPLSRAPGDSANGDEDDDGVSLAALDHFCPRCKSMILRFEVEMLFDKGLRQSRTSWAGDKAYGTLGSSYAPICCRLVTDVPFRLEAVLRLTIPGRPLTTQGGHRVARTGRLQAVAAGRRPQGTQADGALASGGTWPAANVYGESGQACGAPT